MQDSLALRYASALFQIAKAEKKVSQYQTSMKEINTLLKDNYELFNLLKSEFLTCNERYKVADEVLANYPIEIINFIKILIRNHRLSNLSAIAATFNSLCNDENHVLEGIVYSTTPLEENEIKRLETALTQFQKTSVELTNRIDHRLIGGVKVAINHHVYDYSIQNDLLNLRNELKK